MVFFKRSFIVSGFPLWLLDPLLGSSAYNILNIFIKLTSHVHITQDSWPKIIALDQTVPRFTSVPLYYRFKHVCRFSRSMHEKNHWHENKPATNKRGDRWDSVQWERSSVMFYPIRAGRTLLGWVLWAGTAEPADLVRVMLFSVGWSLHPIAALRGRSRTVFISFSSTICYRQGFEILNKDDNDNQL